MSFALIIDICQALQKEGKKPTTALVKTRLPHPLPLAQVMKAIQMYQANPEIEIPQAKEEIVAPSKHCECSPYLQSLQQQIDQLRSQVTVLQAQVQDLSAE